MKNITTIDISTKTIFKIIFSLVLIWLVIQLKLLVILLFIAFIIATAVRPLVKTLENYKIKKGFAVAIIYVIMLALLVILLYLTIKPLGLQMIDLAENLPTILDNAQNNIPFLASFDLQAIMNSLIDTLKSSGQGLVLSAAGVAADVATSMLTAIVISLYLVLDMDRMTANLIKFVPKDNRERVMTNYRKIEDQVGAWLRGQLFLMFLIGIITYIILKILGIPFALPLSIFAGLMEILPLIGPIIYSSVIVIVALTVGPLTAILSAIFGFIVQSVEAHILVPQIMKKAVGLSPVTTILAILAGGTLMGIIGALLAVPITAVISAIVEDIFLKGKE